MEQDIFEKINSSLKLREENGRDSAWQDDMVQVYTGKTIRLRPVRESDAATSYAWRVDPVVRDGEIGYPFPTSLEAEISWIRSSNSHGNAPHTIIFGIEEYKNKNLMGYVSLYGLDWASKTGELGVVIGPPNARGKGIGHEAVELLLKISFYTFGLSRVWLRVLEGNIAARRLYEKCGFSYEGVLRNHVFSRGAHRNVVVMGVLASEFAEREKTSPFWEAKREEEF